MSRPPILEGQEWRIAWKELDFRTRRRIRRCVRRARPADGVREAALAVGLARRRQRRNERSLLILPLLLLAGSFVLGVGIRVDMTYQAAAGDTLLDPFFWGIPAVFGALFPFAWLRRQRRWRRAEDENRDVVLALPPEKWDMLTPNPVSF